VKGVDLMQVPKVQGQEVQGPEVQVRDKQPLLTIAIPTFNRARYLDLCLKRIGEEIAGLSEDRRCKVKIYVSDNASPDDTPEVVARYKAKHPGAFEAVRNDTNSGPDTNIAQCYDSATTPYVWIIGDDDVLLHGGLGRVLDVLTNEDIDILYVNNYWFKDSYTEKPIRQGKHGTLTFSEPLDFTRRTNVMLTFISGLIVRSGVGLKYRSELMASNLVQLSWVLPQLREGKRFAIIKNWVVAAKGSNSGGYGLAMVFGENLKKITEKIFKDRPELARVIQNGTIVNFFPGLIINSCKGTDNFAEKDMASVLKNVYGDNWRHRVFLLPLFALPLLLGRCYYYLIILIRIMLGPLLI
jgi:abequosyltransferase